VTSTDADSSDAVAVSSPGQLFDLTGKTAIVTGASSGLGRRSAQVLHAAGANVVLAGRRLDLLQGIAESMERVVAVRCDVGRDADCALLVDSALLRFGSIEVLVNNAGITKIVDAEQEDLASFRQVVEVNLTAAFHLSQLVVRAAEGRPVSIVNVASIHGLVSSAPIKQAGYNASKAGLIGLTRELAGQWGRRGVRVNALAPGYFPSEMTAEMMHDDQSLVFVARNTAFGRPGRPEELDGALLLLASDAGTYITGATIVVDGGWTSR
jgi:NAD(P)-dependent dehydrogenase (short-subunit alcohol dehydrogenase family)